MPNIPTSEDIVPFDASVEGPNSGVEGGASDSVMGICTNIPNPKDGDWDRQVTFGLTNPIGQPRGFQYLSEYKTQSFDRFPVGFAQADTQAAPGQVYATNAGGFGYDFVNKTDEHITQVGDWLWGVASPGGTVCVPVTITQQPSDAVV